MATLDQLSLTVTYSRITGLWTARLTHWPVNGNPPRALAESKGDLPAAADPEELAHHCLSHLASETAQLTVPMGTRDPWTGERI